jgi:hypothetical protein
MTSRRHSLTRRSLIAATLASAAVSQVSAQKIAYLPRKLTEEGSGPFSNEAAGDFCYFAPWGNLVFYHAGYPYWKGLIRLGRRWCGAFAEARQVPPAHRNPLPALNP